MIIGIDFDGTCVTHEFPDIGKDIGAIPVLRKLVENGHQLILFTMRSEEYLEEAVRWFERNGIELYGIQTNPDQAKWTTSPKAYCQLYIDDAGLGIPLKETAISNRSYVDWDAVGSLLYNMKLL